MIRDFCYAFKILTRNKMNAFWILLFPIALGTLFYAGFSGLDDEEMISPIPVAVVCDDSSYSEILLETLENVDVIDETQLTMEDAKAQLEAKEITGIITADSDTATVSLTISGNMVNDSLNQSILESFVDQFNLTSTTAQKTMAMPDFDETICYNEEVSLRLDTEANTYTQYFYNLIAMACLYTSMGGVLVANNNQGNLSTIAARKNVSSSGKFKSILAELSATIVFEFLLNLVGFMYLAFVLKVGVDYRLPYAILALFIGCVFGVTSGFFLGVINQKDKDFKTGLVFAISMPLCFLSGLMVGDMHMLVEEYCPIINRLNPAKLISDSFYVLGVYENTERFTYNCIVLLLYVAFFTISGFLLTRRKKYASL